MFSNLFNFKWRKIRWSGDTDRQWGPFMVSGPENRKERYGAFLLHTETLEDDRDVIVNQLHISLFDYTVIISLPNWLKPKVVHHKSEYGQWDEHVHREYGFTLYENHLTLRYGLQYGDAMAHGKSAYLSCFLPWEERTLLRVSLLDDSGQHEVWRGDRLGDDYDQALKVCPRQVFEFEDFDGEVIEATVHLKELEYGQGDGWFKWLRFFFKNEVYWRLEIEFSKETGERKGSWKGGTLACSTLTEKGMTAEEAFHKYSQEHQMKVLRLVSTQ